MSSKNFIIFCIVASIVVIGVFYIVHPKFLPSSSSIGPNFFQKSDEQSKKLFDEEKSNNNNNSTSVSSGKDEDEDEENDVSIASDFEEQKRHFDKHENTRRKSIADESKLALLQMFVVPQISCPTAVRVGSIGDGGKWVCNPWRAPKHCVVYSFGVSGDTSFELDMHETTKKRCKIYSFDITPQKDELFTPFQGVFRQWKISDKTDVANTEWSIIDIAKKFSHRRIDFVKIDIEGNEFKAMPVFLNSTLISKGKVCQIFIELHSYVSSWKSLQAQLEKCGFLMFYKEANMFCTACYEFSYIHQSCLNRYGVKNELFNKNY